MSIEITMRDAGAACAGAAAASIYYGDIPAAIIFAVVGVFFAIMSI